MEFRIAKQTSLPTAQDLRASPIPPVTGSVVDYSPTSSPACRESRPDTTSHHDQSHLEAQTPRTHSDDLQLDAFRLQSPRISTGGTFLCPAPGCDAPGFQTQYLLNLHTGIHNTERPYSCPVENCPRSKVGNGFKRKNEMIRHGFIHRSPGYPCPFCPDREYVYPRPDNLQRHVRSRHPERDKNDPTLLEVLSQRRDGPPNRGRRRRTLPVEPKDASNSVAPSSVTPNFVSNFWDMVSNFAPKPEGGLFHLPQETSVIQEKSFSQASPPSGEDEEGRFDSDFSPTVFASTPPGLSPLSGDTGCVDPSLIFTSDPMIVQNASSSSILSRPLVRSRDISVELDKENEDGSLTMHIDRTTCFTCQSLNIGGWAQTAGTYGADLTVSYSVDRSTMMYLFEISGTTYKIEYPFAYIKAITIVEPDGPDNNVSNALITLFRPPHIFLQRSLFGGFHPCPDFTKDRQVSQKLAHCLKGDFHLLMPQLREFLRLESFINRHKFSEADVEQVPHSCKDDEIFTDSGYASVPNATYPTSDRAQDRNVSGNSPEPNSLPDEEDADETQTVFSAATTAHPHFVQESIDWVCDDIYNNVSHAVGSAGYKQLGDRLPGLLKAFAVEFGADASNPLSLRIMHFVYKHHSKIISQLNARFDPQADDGSEPRKDDCPDMSVCEKIELWGRKASHVSPEGELGAFDSVKVDEEDEDEDGNEDQPVEPLDLPSYSKVILNSSAYQWLLSALGKQSSLHWGTSQTHAKIDEIRNVISQRLPTGTISQNRLPRTFKVSFRLLWEPIEERVNQERARWMTAKLGPHSLANLIVLTGPGDDELQASTVGKYFHQTWSDRGVDLLRPLQILLDREAGSHPMSVTNANTMDSQFSLEGPHLVVTLSGPAYFIAQCGEQLAWLVSVVQPLKQEEGAIYTSCVSETSDLEFSIEAKPEPFPDSTVPPPVDSKPLQLFYSRITPSCIARGFPIARRPEGFPGLEVPWYHLLMMVQKPALDSASNCRNDRRLLRGSHATLALVKIANGVSLWHISSPTSVDCVCSNSYSVRTNSEQVASITFEDLSLFRHIVNMCERDSDPQAQALRKILSPMGVLDTPMEDQQLDPPVHDPAASPCEPSTPRSPPDPSIDSDMLSISSCSQDSHVGRLDGDDMFLPLSQVVCDSLLADFHSSTRVRPTHPNGGNGANVSSTSSATFPPQARISALVPGVSRKRLFSQRNNDDDDEDGFQRYPIKKPEQKEVMSQSTFACPFWKYDPIQYRACFLLTLRGVSRVKQHLLRNHHPEFYCQRCLAIFKKLEDYSEHVMQPPGSICVPNPSSRLDGISPQQQRQLSRKSKHPTSSEAEKWFTIWDIVFPQRPRPSSPYLDGQLTEDCALFQEHALNRGPDIVMQEIEASGSFLVTGLTEDARREVLRQAIGTGLSALVTAWTHPREWAQNTPSSGAAPFPRAHEGGRNLETLRGEPPAGSDPDSGVLIASLDSESPSSQTYSGPMRPSESRHTAAGQDLDSIVRAIGAPIAVEHELVQQDPPCTLMGAFDAFRSNLPLQEEQHGAHMQEPNPAGFVNDNGIGSGSFGFHDLQMPMWEDVWAVWDFGNTEQDKI